MALFKTIQTTYHGEICFNLDHVARIERDNRGAVIVTSDGRYFETKVDHQLLCNEMTGRSGGALERS